MITDYTLWNGDTILVKIEGNRVTYFVGRDTNKVWTSYELGKDYNGEEDTFYELEPIALTIDELINFSNESYVNGDKDYKDFLD